MHLLVFCFFFYLNDVSLISGNSHTTYEITYKYRISKQIFTHNPLIIRIGTFKMSVLFTFAVNSLNKYKFVTVANMMMNTISKEENGFKMRTISCENLGCFFCNTSPMIRGGKRAKAKVATFPYGTMPLSKMVRPKVNVQSGMEPEKNKK